MAYGMKTSFPKEEVMSKDACTGLVSGVLSLSHQPSAIPTKMREKQEETKDPQKRSKHQPKPPGIDQNSIS
jgi:hypothetical protein